MTAMIKAGPVGAPADIDRLNSRSTGLPSEKPSVPGEFQKTLESSLNQPNLKGGAGINSDVLKFSQHAIDRMRSRGIAFDPETMGKIEDAVNRAAQKGSKDTLILTGDSALVVSAKNKTVVTVMDRAGMKDNVFTNIDSTVFV